MLSNWFKSLTMQWDHFSPASVRHETAQLVFPLLSLLKVKGERPWLKSLRFLRRHVWAL